NLYETRIGRFCEDAPGVVDSVDPQTLSYEQVPGFLSKESNLSRFKGKTVMMYCTGGVRCERASSLLCSHLGETAEVFQLEGGIHRYLEKFPSGGFFQGAMYVFDRRRAVRGYDLLGEAQHERQILGTCCLCGSSWEMYQGKWKCGECKMPILICLQCQGRCSHAGEGGWARLFQFLFNL
ncbi:Rhodanese-like domain-containing protein 6 (Sulfurtransferase 6) (AtStr6), partial [Durusdinium trenchii]